MKMDNMQALLFKDIGIALAKHKIWDREEHLLQAYEYIQQEKYVPEPLASSFTEICLTLFKVKLSKENFEHVRRYIDNAIAFERSRSLVEAATIKIETKLSALQICIEAQVEVGFLIRFVNELIADFKQIKDHAKVQSLHLRFHRYAAAVFNETRHRKEGVLVEEALDEVDNAFKLMPQPGPDAPAHLIREYIELLLIEAQSLECLYGTWQATDVFKSAYDLAIILFNRNAFVYSNDLIHIMLVHANLLVLKGDDETASSVLIDAAEIFKCSSKLGLDKRDQMLSIFLPLSEVLENLGQNRLAATYLKVLYKALIEEFSRLWSNVPYLLNVAERLLELDLALGYQEKSVARYEALLVNLENLFQSDSYDDRSIFKSKILCMIGFAAKNNTQRQFRSYYEALSLYATEFNLDWQKFNVGSGNSRFLKYRWSFIGKAAEAFLSLDDVAADDELTHDTILLLIGIYENEYNISRTKLIRKKLYPLWLKAAFSFFLSRQYHNGIMQLAQYKLALLKFPKDKEEAKNYSAEIRKISDDFKLLESVIHNQINIIINDGSGLGVKVFNDY